VQFQDNEIDAFQRLSGGVVLLAAAQALDTLAANAALVQGRRSLPGSSSMARSSPSR
jgi:hypothetical protein